MIKFVRFIKKPSNIVLIVGIIVCLIWWFNTNHDTQPQQQPQNNTQSTKQASTLDSMSDAELENNIKSLYAMIKDLPDGTGNRELASVKLNFAILYQNELEQRNLDRLIKLTGGIK